MNHNQPKRRVVDKVTSNTPTVQRLHPRHRAYCRGGGVLVLGHRETKTLLGDHFPHESQNLHPGPNLTIVTT